MAETLSSEGRRELLGRATPKPFRGGPIVPAAAAPPDRISDGERLERWYERREILGHGGGRVLCELLTREVEMLQAENDRLRQCIGAALDALGRTGVLMAPSEDNPNG